MNSSRRCASCNRFGTLMIICTANICAPVCAAGYVRVETSAMEAYGPTRGFYAGMRYTEEARFRDFYRAGDDLIILAKRL